MQDIKLSNFGMQSQNDDFIVEFEVASLNAELFNEIDKKIQNVDNQIQSLEDRIAVLNTDIDRLTNHADGLDYAVAVGSGILCGVIDSLFVGEFNFEKAKDNTHEQVKDFIMAIAKKNGYKGDKLSGAIAFLEEKFPVLQDSALPNGVSRINHHLTDFAHHPTILGLLCAILVEFFRAGIFVSPNGEWHFEFINNLKGLKENWLPILIGCMLSGILMWLVYIVESKYKTKIDDSIPKPIQKLIKLLAKAPAAIMIFKQIAKVATNWAGHLVSDMGGSKNTAGDGMGIPGIFLSLLYEISSLPILKDTGLPGIIKKWYQKDKFDLRAELAVINELSRQAIPVAINEILVRTFYFVRHLIEEISKNNDLSKIDWSKTIPVGNRTITRMITIASGTFMAFDLADAAIRSAIKNKGHTYYNPLFWKDIVLRVNFVGVGRFVVALGVDACSGYKRSMLVKERMQETSKLIMYNNVKIFYLQEKMWIEAKNTQEAINALCDIMEISIMQAIENTKENIENIGIMDSNLKQLEKVDPEFRKELADIAIFSKKE